MTSHALTTPDQGPPRDLPARPLPRSFDVVVVVILVQAHLAALLTVLTLADSYRSVPATLACVAVALAVPLACVVVARLRGGADLPLGVFAGAGAALLVVDLVTSFTVRDARIGTPGYWAPVAVGVTLLALCPYRPPRDLMLLAAAHAAVVAAVLLAHRDAQSVQPFAVLSHLAASVIPAAAAAEFVRHYVRALRRRQHAVAEQARAQARVVAAAAVQEDSDQRLTRLRTEVLPLLQDVAAGRRAVDDPDGAALAERSSAGLRRELVEARSGAWLLAAPVATIAGASGTASSDDGWPGVVLLDPQRLLGRLGSHDRAALSAVLAALRTAGGWTGVSVALSIGYPVGDAAFVTVVAHGEHPLADVDPGVVAAAARAACTASIERPATCVVEGSLPLPDSARLDE